MFDVSCMLSLSHGITSPDFVFRYYQYSASVHDAETLSLGPFLEVMSPGSK